MLRSRNKICAQENASRAQDFHYALKNCASRSRFSLSAQELCPALKNSILRSRLAFRAQDSAPRA